MTSPFLLPTGDTRGWELLIAGLVPAASPPSPELAEEADRLAGDLHAFARAAWPLLEPTTPFVDGPHVAAICLHLEAVTRWHEWAKAHDPGDPFGPPEVRDLLITVPPRSLKSTLVSVLWPAWEWARDPSVRYLTASYAADLATRDAVRSRRLIRSDWYQSRWGHTFRMTDDQDVKTRYENDRAGHRIATSPGGGATGQGGERVVCDDPLNVRDAGSESARLAAIEWWDGTMSSRLNDPKRGARVVVQQRVHEEDLAGHLIAQGGWVHLNLPQEWEGDEAPTAIGWRDWRTEEGAFLAPERFGPAEKAKALLTLGAYGYAAQHQQRPAPAEGGILKREHWRRYARAELPLFFRRVAVFADTASKTKQRNDYTVFALWGEAEDGWWLLAMVRRKVEFPGLLALAEATWARWGLFGPGRRPTQFVVEEASSGIALIQTLQKGTRIPVVPYSPHGRDPEERVRATSGYQAAGKLAVPATGVDALDWQDCEGEDPEGWVKEHGDYPTAKHDDRVTPTAMMLFYWEIDPPEAKGKHAPAGSWSSGRAKTRLVR